MAVPASRRSRSCVYGNQRSESLLQNPSLVHVPRQARPLFVRALPPTVGSAALSCEAEQLLGALAGAEPVASDLPARHVTGRTCGRLLGSLATSVELWGQGTECQAGAELRGQ